MNHLIKFEKYLGSDVDDILNQISKFIESNLRNVWVRNDEIEIYVRKSKRMFRGQFLDFFDFASINVTETGNGLFTNIISRFEEIYPNKNIFIESVLTDRFADYIKNKLGFEEEENNVSNNFYKVKVN